MSSTVDALNFVAPILKVRPELQDVCRFAGSWRVSQPYAGAGWAAFHIVTQGVCQIERKGFSPLFLTAGDVLMLPHGDEHVVYGVESQTPEKPAATRYHEHIRFIESPSATIETEVICGRFHLENGTQNLLLLALPQVILLQLDGVRRYAELITLIQEELDGEKAGAACVASGLASALFVMALRQHMERDPPALGLFGLLVARETARAAAAMISEPSRNWTLEELASIAAVSRPTLVRAFRRMSGMPPAAFLTELRLGLARNRILNTLDSIDQIAIDVGYKSEAALSRAFLRRFACRPAAMRRNPFHL